jgi:hypothetical protein
MITTMLAPEIETPRHDGSPAERIRYQIDRHDAITSVSDSWASFARANGAPQLAEGVFGRSLWEFVSELTTEHLYRDLVRRVRAGRTITFPYRCDAPALRRFMQMTMTPGSEDSVTFDSVTLRTEQRAAVPVSHSPHLRTDLLLKMCSWCKRIDVEGDWEEIERAVARLGLFTGERVPALTHSICPDCIALMDADTSG